ncbi:MAG: Uma2 family endonuclease [Saprospiraceae bacterium]|nr:Uma2 family endonuclease [Saprospiraceae bacterium]
MKPITDLSQLDLEGVYTYADYLTWKFEQAVELIKGKILPMAAPSRRHQRISWRLSGSVFNYLKGQPCEAYTAPFDVRLLDKKKSEKANKEVYTVIQPDLCIICDRDKLDDAGCIGAPDLIVEILSPGNSKKEMKIKKELYEQSSVREYWVIDPERETVHRYNLATEDKYGGPEVFVSDDTMLSIIFPTINIPLEELFSESF